MTRYFGLKLTIVLISFTLIISFASAVFDYNKLKDEVRAGHETKIKMAGDKIVDALHTIDQIYEVTDRTTANKMKENTEIMLNMYEKDPEFNNWDFSSLSKKFGMDIFIINAENVVVNSSFEPDIGLDFDECCGSLARALDERRKGSSFHHDGMDAQQATGEIKTFSYMPTPDGKYLLELSMLLEKDELFKQFNFLNAIASMKDDYDAINSIHVYSRNGLILGYTDIDGEPKMISDEMRPVFLEALREEEAKDVVKKTEQGPVTYRYIPYTADDRGDYLVRRVVEIIYNEAELEGLLKFYQYDFINRQIFILLAVSLLSIIIARLIAKPVHLSFHDSLTGLKNRAAFEVETTKRLKKKNDTVALMMIDIDNFKIVNDELGHIEGDFILVHTAEAIQRVVGKQGIAARLGGDEFIVIFSNAQKAEITQIATLLLKEINSGYLEFQKEKEINVSISIGIAYAIEGEELNEIYDKADQALYASKENGKNQYTLYSS